MEMASKDAERDPASKLNGSDIGTAPGSPRAVGGEAVGGVHELLPLAVLGDRSILGAIDQSEFYSVSNIRAALKYFKRYVVCLALGCRASAAEPLNSSVLDRYPQRVNQAVIKEWCSALLLRDAIGCGVWVHQFLSLLPPDKWRLCKYWYRCPTSQRVERSQPDVCRMSIAVQWMDSRLSEHVK